ncbi:putative lipid membrane protein [Diachasmimorpha longicaudata entomopoxvirus]|uniref:Putative lipid membrane protein n=1 Tax=Diachasmimorpha longicaudata entomopoxvirus TaxID=109981 RepID=A0A7R5WJY1_9POXV|nr:putative lipid membrane protein [Diachasmimorpha longicaudata entomopoxvirus]AKS26331.1 putative lipid membrane protein [Diachasmimorpha longicaudata entomopoxvirus]
MDLSGFKEDDFFLYEKIMNTFFTKLYISSAIASGTCNITIKRLVLKNSSTCKIDVKNVCMLNSSKTTSLLIESIKDNEKFITKDIEKKLKRFNIDYKQWDNSELKRTCEAFASVENTIDIDTFSIENCYSSTDSIASIILLNSSDASANCVSKNIVKALGASDDGSVAELQKIERDKQNNRSIIQAILTIFIGIIFLVGLLVWCVDFKNIFVFSFKSLLKPPKRI